MPKKLKEKNLYCFTVGENYALAYLAILDGILFICVFEELFDDVSVETIESVVLTPFLGAWTQDSRIKSGTWRLLCESYQAPEIMYPKYLMPIGDESYLANVRGKIERLATAEEKLKTPRMFSVSPVTFEKAMTAHHEGDWQSRFDKLLL